MNPLVVKTRLASENTIIDTVMQRTRVGEWAKAPLQYPLDKLRG